VREDQPRVLDVEVVEADEVDVLGAHAGLREGLLWLGVFLVEQPIERPVNRVLLAARHQLRVERRLG
jgi:hypothetical protein